MNSEIQSWLPLVTGVASVGALCFGFWQLWWELCPRMWDRVPGVIVFSEIKMQRTGRGGYQFVNTVEYEYQRFQKTFRSTRRRAGNWEFGTREDAEVIKALYPVDAKVSVFVHPLKPDKSVLEYGVTPISLFGILIGSIFLIVAVCSY